MLQFAIIDIASHFEKVIVFDRDALPDVPWPRGGTPQAWHTHRLLPSDIARSNVCFPASSATCQTNLASAARLYAIEESSPWTAPARAATLA